MDFVSLFTNNSFYFMFCTNFDLFSLFFKQLRINLIVNSFLWLFCPNRLNPNFVLSYFYKRNFFITDIRFTIIGGVLRDIRQPKSRKNAQKCNFI